MSDLADINRKKKNIFTANNFPKGGATKKADDRRCWTSVVAQFLF